MSKALNNKRNYRIEFYVNENEYKRILSLQRTTKLSKSALMRRLVLGLEVKPAPAEKIKEVYRLVANLTNNANQIAKIANATGYISPEKIDGLLLMTDKCWQRIKEIS